MPLLKWWAPCSFTSALSALWIRPTVRQVVLVVGVRQAALVGRATLPFICEHALLMDFGLRCLGGRS